MTINCMGVTGSQNEFHYLGSNCPGYWHDSEAFVTSDLFTKLHVEKWRPFPGALILGDSAYK